MYYTGKTLQNRYEGAFVYSRTPDLPQKAMPSIYKIAREAGLDPTRACCIDNKCFDEAASQPAATPPLFTPVAEARTLDASVTASGGGGSSSDATTSGPFSGIRAAVRDVTELLEDPKPPADAMFARQKPMSEVREFDANGYRRVDGLSSLLSQP